MTIVADTPVGELLLSAGMGGSRVADSGASAHYSRIGRSKLGGFRGEAIRSKYAVPQRKNLFEEQIARAAPRVE
jgi:hypothetical protein